MKLGLKITFLIMALMAGNGLLAQNNSTYKKLIEEADLYLKIGDVGFARIDYQKAVLMNPGDQYPRLKIAEIDRKKSDQRRVDSLFEQNLISAEKYFKSGNYNLAQIEYLRSLELKPESVFIKGRLATISGSGIKPEPAKPNNDVAVVKAAPVKQDDIVAKPIMVSAKTETIQPAVSTPLQTALMQGDEFYNAKDFENAAQRYQTALSFKPGDKAIKAKLASTRALLEKQKKDQKAFSDIILAAEKSATQKNTQQTITLYEQAALIKPEDAVLQNKLITLRDRLIVEQNQDRDFKEIITKADKSLQENNLPEAKKGYETARTIKPDDKYPQQKLLEISHIDAIAEADKKNKYKETLVLAQSLLTLEDFQGAYQAFVKASELQPQEGYPKQKITELDLKIKALETQYKIAYSGFIQDATKAFQAKNWDIAMDNYLKALKAKTADTLAGNQIIRIISYMNSKLVTTLTPFSPSVVEGKEVKIPFKAIEMAKRKNQYLVVRVKNSTVGTPRLYINYGLDAQKNGGILYRNLLKGGQYIDYLVRIVNQDRWYRLDNNWISLTVEGGALEVENVKICADF